MESFSTATTPYFLTVAGIAHLPLSWVARLAVTFGITSTEHYLDAWRAFESAEDTCAEWEKWTGGDILLFPSIPNIEALAAVAREVVERGAQESRVISRLSRAALAVATDLAGERLDPEKLGKNTRLVARASDLTNAVALAWTRAGVHFPERGLEERRAALVLVLLSAAASEDVAAQLPEFYARTREGSRARTQTGDACDDGEKGKKRGEDDKPALFPALKVEDTTSCTIPYSQSLPETYAVLMQQGLLWLGEDSVTGMPFAHMDCVDEAEGVCTETNLAVMRDARHICVLGNFSVTLECALLAPTTHAIVYVNKGCAAYDKTIDNRETAPPVHEQSPIHLRGAHDVRFGERRVAIVEQEAVCAWGHSANAFDLLFASGEWWRVIDGRVFAVSLGRELGAPKHWTPVPQHVTDLGSGLLDNSSLSE